MRKKTMLILILLLVILFPFDVSILVNRALGFRLHTILYIILFVIIYTSINGKTPKEKVRNIRRRINV